MLDTVHLHHFMTYCVMCCKAPSWDHWHLYSMLMPYRSFPLKKSLLCLFMVVPMYSYKGNDLHRLIAELQNELTKIIA